MKRGPSIAGPLLALAGCIASPPPAQYSPPPPQYSQPQAPVNYTPPPQQPTYAPPPPQASVNYTPPPQPVYTPEDSGDTVTIDEVPPNDAAPTVDVFNDALAPYGNWVSDGRYGRVWVPNEANYQPYRRGSWQVTDYGWTWISDEPYGWAVTHYGRWVWNGRWMWRPDTVWGPAWVQWRESDGYVGWAPLPPQGGPVVVEERWNFVPAPQVTRIDLVNCYTDPRPIYRSSRAIVRYTRTPRGEVFIAGPDPNVMRTRYNTTIVPSALPTRLTGRYQDDAWRDRRLREERRANEEREWQRQRDERLRQQQEQMRLQQEQQRLEAQRRQFDDQQRRARDDAERRRIADEQRRVEEQQRQIEAQRRQQEEQQRRFAEEQRRAQEQQRVEAQRQAQQQRQLMEQQQRQREEQQRLQQQQRQERQQQEMQRRQQEEQQRRQMEQQQRQQQEEQQRRQQMEQQQRQQQEQQ